jgi:NRPS condensation-like uncharacterized protein
MPTNGTIANSSLPSDKSQADLPQTDVPLSDFEWYMLCDDRPSHPMVFVIAAEVEGELRESELHQACRELLSKQPLLRSVVVGSGKSAVWRNIDLPDDVVRFESVSSEALETRLPKVTRIDLRSRPGILVEVLASADRARITLYLHHACCDGIAGVQLISELLARYGQLTAGDGRKPVFEPPCPEDLRLRENYEPPEPAEPRPKRSVLQIAAKIGRLLFRKPTPVATSAQRGRRGFEAPDQAIRTASLSVDIHRSLRTVASRLNVSLNDVLLREMFLLIRDWNQEAGRAAGRRWIRIAMPLSMRTTLHARIPACNIVSYALVTRRFQECDAPDDLARSIHDQTGNVLFYREGLIALKLFRILRRLSFGMRLFLSAKSCMSTIVVANVGDVRRRFTGRFPLQDGRWIAGNVLIRRIYGVAPVRPNTVAAMSIGDYAGELSISLRTDGTVLSEEDSREFFRRYLQRLENLAQTATTQNAS